MDENKSGTKKSLIAGSIDVVVSHHVKWPQEYVLSGSKKKRVQYDQLNVTQWMADFCRIMKEETNLENKEHMLDYLIQLLEDANGFSWDAASHAVLLCRMEQGDVKNYMQVEKIDRIRRANAQRHGVGSSSNSSFKSQIQKSIKSSPCLYFNKGSCTYTKNHETRGVTYRHVCSACFNASGRHFPHSEIECRNKIRKNVSNVRVWSLVHIPDILQPDAKNVGHADIELKASQSDIATWYKEFKAYDTIVQKKFRIFRNAQRCQIKV